MKNKEINDSSRPWGKYFVLDDNQSYKIKRIEVNPKARLSYQYHKLRSETWVIIKGEGIITIEGKNKKISQGNTIVIPKGSKHRIENKGNDKLIFIEVQTGEYFGEDDIIRIEDDYNRII
jgi:mannose-6-phosphate isomerase